MPLPQFGRYGAVGFELVASIGVGFFVGRALDSHFKTNGVATWIGFFLGVLSGFLLLVRTARQLESEAAKDEGRSASAALDHDQRVPPSDAKRSTFSTAEDEYRKKLEDVEARIADDEKQNRS